MTGQKDNQTWVADSKKANKQLFSELDVLLRALDRFFISENFAPSGEDLASRNFYDELATSRDTILRALGILEVVIPESRKNSYWLQKFAEAKLLTTGKRDLFREGLYRQDSPEKGLYHLYDSFINLKGIISDLAKSENISYMGFMNIGGMISREIRGNNFFNPFRRLLNPEFDVIRNDRISGLVRSLDSRELKKHISVVYIYLFRLLRFMEFIDIETQRPVSLNASLAILILLRSEITVFQGYITKAVPGIKEKNIESLLQSLIYQFSMEAKRVYAQELRDIYKGKDCQQFRGRIENSRGILTNLTEQSIVRLTQYLRPDLKGEEIFPRFVTKMQQSMRLREDIFVLYKLIDALGHAHTQQKRVKVFESLKNYMAYFESFTFKLLRHDDFEDFASFFNDCNSLGKDAVFGPAYPQTLKKANNFNIFLQTVLLNLENRFELKEKSMDMERIDALIRQYQS